MARTNTSEPGENIGNKLLVLLTEANPERIAGLFSCAAGGTSVDAWMPGTRKRRKRLSVRRKPSHEAGGPFK